MDDQQHRSLAVSKLHDYLDDGMRIPRVHLNRDAYDSMSQSSSEYTIREEVKRHVITDVTRKETKTTLTTADVHGTTAEFHVYPPTELTTESHSSCQVNNLFFFAKFKYTSISSSIIGYKLLFDLMKFIELSLFLSPFFFFTFVISGFGNAKFQFIIR